MEPTGLEGLPGLREIFLKKMDWSLSKNKGPQTAHTVSMALEDSYFATSSTLAGLAFTCRPTKAVYRPTQFVRCVLLVFNLQSCKLQHLQTIRKNCLRLTKWCRISGSPPWKHLIRLISDVTHVISFKADENSRVSDFCTHLLIPFAQTGNRNQRAGKWHP